MIVNIISKDGNIIIKTIKNVLRHEINDYCHFIFNEDNEIVWVSGINWTAIHVISNDVDNHIKEGV